MSVASFHRETLDTFCLFFVSSFFVSFRRKLCVFVDASREGSKTAIRLGVSLKKKLFFWTLKDANGEGRGKGREEKKEEEETFYLSFRMRKIYSLQCSRVKKNRRATLKRFYSSCGSLAHV